MASVRDIEGAIVGLSPSELTEFRAWFDRFDAAAWDREFERNARAGKLKAMAETALKDFRKGRCREL
jgi:hypothetical protein